MKRLILIIGLITSFAYAQSKAGFYVVGGQLITVQDTSSRKYLKAVENAGVVPSVLQNMASNYLVTSERAIGSYSLISAQYPFIGGTAATHSLNMNNPNGLASGFTLAYPNGATHDANGVLFNGTNQYANTFFNPTTALSNPKTDISMSYYINGGTGAGNNPTAMGAQGNNNTDYGNYQTALYQFPNLGFIVIGGENFSGNFAGGVSSAFAFAKGYTLGTSKSGSVKLFLKGSLSASATLNASGFAANGNIFIGTASVNTNSPGGNYQNVRLGISTIGLGFTDTQAIQQSQIVTFFNSIQNRQ